MSKSPGHKERLTLEEYLQAQKFRRKIQQRNRSRSKGKKELQSNFSIEHQKSMQNVFQIINTFSNDIKIDLSQAFQKKLAKDKMFIEIAALLDKFILRLKEQIKKMYKDIFTLYTVQNENRGLSQTQRTMEYFKDKMNQAEEQIKKSKLTEVVKDTFKTEDKHKQFCDIMVGKMTKPEQQRTLQVPGKGQNTDTGGSFMEALLGMSAQSVEIKEHSETHSNEEKDKVNPKLKENPPMTHTVSAQSPRGRQPERKHHPRTPHSKEKP